MTEDRQVAIYLSKVMSGQASKKIGRYFGIKEPAVSKVVKWIEEGGMRKSKEERRLSP